MPEEDKDWEKKFVDLLRETHRKEINRLESKLDDKLGDLNKKIQEIPAELIDRIDANKSTVDNDLDEVDKAFRGNGRIGIFEQLRSLKRHMSIMWLFMLVLLGFKLFGITIEQWWDNFLQDAGMRPKAQQVAPAKVSKVNPGDPS
tara:strand:+ start:1923 stop:2357 length:435 start_codon:yes stop_codon:yes gene_type:complete